MKTPVLSTLESPPCLIKRGGSPLPLAPDAVLPATLSDLTCSSETLLSLTAICTGLLAETLSQDAMFLALMRAARESEKMGIRLTEFQRVQDIILRHWSTQRRQNPLSKMF
jgi:hypothetical protein